MNDNTFAQLWASFAVPVDNAGTPIINGLMALCGPWFKLGVPAYLIVVMLIAMWTGDDKANLLLFRSAFLASILYALSFVAGTFEYWVEGLVHGTTQEIRAAVIGAIGQPITDANAYDILRNRTYAAGLVVLKSIPWYSPKMIPIGIGVIVYWLMTAYAVVSMFISDLTTYALGDLLIDFAPLFIPLYFFPFARRWFDGWLGCLMTTVVAQILVAALISLFMAAINITINQFANSLTMPSGVDGADLIDGMMALWSLAMVGIAFTPLAGGIFYVAARIGGGVYTHAAVLPTPGWFGGGSQQHNTQHNTQNGGSIANAGPHSPVPQQAFLRTVGSAR